MLLDTYMPALESGGTQMAQAAALESRFGRPVRNGGLKLLPGILQQNPPIGGYQ
jgi:hypothetical protein